MLDNISNSLSNLIGDQPLQEFIQVGEAMEKFSFDVNLLELNNDIQRSTRTGDEGISQVLENMESASNNLSQNPYEITESFQNPHEIIESLQRVSFRLSKCILGLINNIFILFQQLKMKSDEVEKVKEERDKSIEWNTFFRTRLLPQNNNNL